MAGLSVCIFFMCVLLMFFMVMFGLCCMFCPFWFNCVCVLMSSVCWFCWFANGLCFVVWVCSWFEFCISCVFANVLNGCRFSVVWFSFLFSQLRYFVRCCCYCLGLFVILRFVSVVAHSGG